QANRMIFELRFDLRETRRRGRLLGCYTLFKPGQHVLDLLASSLAGRSFTACAACHDSRGDAGHESRQTGKNSKRSRHPITGITCLPYLLQVLRLVTNVLGTYPVCVRQAMLSFYSAITASNSENSD